MYNTIKPTKTAKEHEMFVDGYDQGFKRVVVEMNKRIREYGLWARNMSKIAKEPKMAVERVDIVIRGFERGKARAYRMVVRNLIRERQKIQIEMGLI